jgi:O-antigen/teichoic acid export membrane protein
MFRPIAVANLCKGMALVAGCVLLVKGPADLVWAIAMYAAAPLIATAILAGHSCRKLHVNAFGKPRLSDMISGGRQSIAFAGISMGAALYGVIPLYVLAWLGGMEQVGIFSAAQRPVLIAASTVMPLATTFYPLISENYRNPEKFRAFQSLFQHLVLILTVPLVILAVSNGDYVMSLLYGNKYADAHVLFRVMSLVIPLSALRLTFSHPLLAGHRQGVAAANAFKAAAATALFACAFVVPWGAVGAACATVAGEAFFTALSMVTARRLFSVPLPRADCRPIALAACAMTAMAVIPGPRMFWIGLSAAVFAAMILAFDGLAKDARRMVVNRLLK